MSLSVTLTLKFIKDEKFRHYFLKKKKRTLSSNRSSIYNQYVDGHTHTKRWKAFFVLRFWSESDFVCQLCCSYREKNVLMLIPAFTAVPQPVEVNDLDRPQN